LCLQSLYGFEHLPDLIRFRHAFIILNVDTRITLPGSFVNPMAAARLPGFAKVIIADFAQVIKTDPFRVLAKAGENLLTYFINHDLQENLMTALGYQSTLELPYEAALEKVIEALKAGGFGVLTNIDVKETMKKKLGAEFRKYTILGACNPPLAHKALSARPDVGLLLPCNVIVYEEGDKTVVNIIDPLSMTGFIQDPSLDQVADEASLRLRRVSEAIQR